MDNLPFKEIPYEEITDKVKLSLKGYKMLKKNSNLKPGMHIRYIKKTNNSKYYGGLFSKFIDKGILQLYTKGRKWMIYKDDSYIFYKLVERGKFRKLLKSFLDNFDIKIN